MIGLNQLLQNPNLVPILQKIIPHNFVTWNINQIPIIHIIQILQVKIIALLFILFEPSCKDHQCDKSLFVDLAGDKFL